MRPTKDQITNSKLIGLEKLNNHLAQIKEYFQVKYKLPEPVAYMAMAMYIEKIEKQDFADYFKSTIDIEEAKQRAEWNLRHDSANFL